MVAQIVRSDAMAGGLGAASGEGGDGGGARLVQGGVVLSCRRIRVGWASKVSRDSHKHLQFRTYQYAQKACEDPHFYVAQVAQAFALTRVTCGSISLKRVST